jgi:hypothetical protein
MLINKLTSDLGLLVSRALLAGRTILLHLELFNHELLVLAAVIIGFLANIAFEAE